MTNVGAWCVAVLLVLAAPAWGGATLRGVVVRDREHGAPLAGVELTAPGANPFTTGNDGRFVLAFPRDHPEQDVVQNPDVYRPYLALTLTNLGNLNRDENRKAEARKNFEEALAIYHEFTPRAPATYLSLPNIVHGDRGLKPRTI
jgi:hypothetical protein